MWKLVTYLLAGIALLAIGVYFGREFTHGSQPERRQLSSAPVHTPDARQSSSLPGDARTLGAASLKEYGVLVHTQPETTAVNAPEPSPPSGPPAAFEHVTTTPASGPNHFLHKRLVVKTYKAFELEVPPHSVQPQLEGTFRSVAARGAGGDDSTELMLLNEQEFADFVHHGQGTATYSADAANRGKVHWRLGTTSQDPQKYYLVFRNPSERQGAKTVEADFTVSFE